MQQRIITGAFGVAAIVGALYLSEWGYFILFLGLSILCQVEFYSLLFKDGNAPLRWYGTVVGTILYVASFFIARGNLSADWLYMLPPLMAVVYFIKLYKKVEIKPFTNIGFTFLGIVYTAFPFSLLNEAAYLKGQYHFQVVMGIFLLLWASDSGAYFAGVKFGKTKLFERVSPKKSWEGSIGGAMASLFTAFVLTLYFHDLSALQWFGISIVIVIAGTYGDLVESLFKRSISIKDSGTAIPGHGGFLDRFDGLLLSLPFITPLLKLLS